MLSFTKSYGLFSHNPSPRTRRPEPQVSVALEFRQERPRRDDLVHRFLSPRRCEEAVEVLRGTFRIPLWGWGFVVVVTLFVVAAVFSSTGVEEDLPRSPESSQPVDPYRMATAMAFSPDGQVLASCGWDQVVHFWDVSRLNDGRVVEPVETACGSMQVPTLQLTMAFSPDSKTLAMAGIGSATILDRRSDEYTIVLQQEGMTYHCLAFSPDGRSLALGGEDHQVRIWDMPSGHERAVLQGHVSAVRSVSFSSDGRRLVSTAQDRIVMVWDTIHGVAIRTLCDQPGFNVVQFGAFSPDGLTVAVGEAGGNPTDIMLFEVETGALRMRLIGHLMGVNALAFSPDGRILASAGLDGSVRLWDSETGKEKSRRVDDFGMVRALSFSADGARLAFAGSESSVRFWDLKTQQ